MNKYRDRDGDRWMETITAVGVGAILVKTVLHTSIAFPHIKNKVIMNYLMFYFLKLLFKIRFDHSPGYSV